ncbi:MAG: SDR family oxidoreductase [Verrucomicrobiota bacterium]
MTIEQQVCIITGGAKGIGLATAKLLLARGAKVASLDLEACPLSQVMSVPCDVTHSAEVQGATEKVTQQLGPVSVWVNNAGLARHRWIQDYSESEIDLMLAVNLKGTILGSQAALKAMMPQKRGHIINVISTASLRGIPSETVYCAAKWGVRGFTQGLAEEAAAHRIRVTALLPGGVDTAFWDDASERQAPRQLFLKPEHIADGIVRCIEMDDFCVPRELVLRSLDDSDFSVKPEV